MTSNFFHIREGVLYTAQRDILLGVTRTMVIRAARGSGVEVRYSPLKLDQLPAVEEAFITSSSRGIVPVIQIDEVTVGQGRVGELTKQLSAAYEAYVIQKAERI
jgi:branched-subunit amino acid aminotransferase/4-amino-4-deoxychorismate lyase